LGANQQNPQRRAGHQSDIVSVGRGADIGLPARVGACGSGRPSILFVKRLELSQGACLHQVSIDQILHFDYIFLKIH
jgi:hypothetical protein